MQSSKLRIGIISAEKSGDYLAASFIESLKSSGRDFELFGIGGKELDKFNIRKNLYNQQSEKDNEIYLIKERIADLDDVRIIRTGLSFILEPENINKRLEIIESYQKHSVMGEDTFNYIESFSY